MDITAPRIQLLGRDITLDEAREEEDDILNQMTYPNLRLRFVISLLEQEREILETVALHLNITSSMCKLSPVEEWRHGSFNFAIPINVNLPNLPRVILRIPLPYKVGEAHFPGNIDEKLRCEAATYIYIQKNCPEVPIPTLHGFGLPNGSHFIPLKRLPIYLRVYRCLEDFIRTILQRPKRVPFVRRHFPGLLNCGYLLLDYIEGRLLSDSFLSQKDIPAQRHNLFRDLSRIMISLGRIPQPHIGSFTIDHDGKISLSNRPLTLRLHCLENQAIPTCMDRRKTYNTSASYAQDILRYHDNRIIYQPNSISGLEDGRKQMAAISIMRSLLPNLTPSKHFVLTLTDLHQSNIFVDEEWRITCLIDLEWACTLPVQLQQPPYWITGCDLDDLTAEKLDAFSATRDEFMTIYKQEEACNITLSEHMQQGWDSGFVWCFNALATTTGFYNLFLQHILPRFSPSFPFNEVFPFWRQDAELVILKKLRDREEYLDALDTAASSGGD